MPRRLDVNVVIMPSARITGTTTLAKMALDTAGSEGRTLRAFITQELGMRVLLVDDQREGGMGLGVRLDVSTLYNDPDGKALFEKLGIDLPKRARLDYEESAMRVAKDELRDNMISSPNGLLMFMPTSGRMLLEAEQRMLALGAKKVIIYGVMIDGNPEELEDIFQQRLAIRKRGWGEIQGLLDQSITTEGHVKSREKLRGRLAELDAPYIELPHDATISVSCALLRAGMYEVIMKNFS